MILNYVVCPECNERIEFDDQVRIVLEEKRGRGWELECKDGHAFSLHAGVMATRLQPNHYDVFGQIQGIERGRKDMCVGEWDAIKLSKPFERIDAIKTFCYSECDDLLYVRSEAQFDNTTPNEFWLMTSGNEAEWGKRVCIDWIAYGAVPTMLDIWRENLIFAARQFLAANYRPCVLQSAVAVESFVYDFVVDYLDRKAGWDSATIKYIHDVGRDPLPLQGVIQVCIHEIMGIRISERVRVGWKRLRQMRNALAHGNLLQYKKLTDSNGQRFASERDRAEFAYKAAVRFIYEIRYPDKEENPIC